MEYRGIQKIIKITQTTMKRLLNYKRVVDKEAKADSKLQWVNMTLENMRLSEASRRKAERIGAIVAYSGIIFKIQNKMIPYRSLDGDYLLYNMLIELMNELKIPIEVIEIDSLTVEGLNLNAKLASDTVEA
ncbi:hypothetical protein DSCW_36050 [Desulfosarcina widdelii]|uniref:Uncharacterized protein n=1 Tax=Desulfosarcina widdelii TaxID=947919 RepID=A0A5K7Z5A7_9BACT|nr:hypothetical protein [Desulfosarcina widdelii]BBO76188.1 hypothetical protein DSCW_36050 [Desulfosarcina widdelii]